MATSYTASEVAALVMDDCLEDLDSGEEEIPEDPSFPLPRFEEDRPDGDPFIQSAGVCVCVHVYNNKSKTNYMTLLFTQTQFRRTKTAVPAQEGEGGVVEGEGGRGRGRGRGRGSSGRGRGTASHLGGGFTPSTLAWEEVDSATDTAPSSLPFTRTSESTVTLDPTASPVQFLDHFLDEDILGLVLEETNK